MHAVRSAGLNRGGGGQYGKHGGGGSGGGGGMVLKNKGHQKGTVYRIGKQTFTLDGKDGKTLDDIIEVSRNKNLDFRE